MFERKVVSSIQFGEYLKNIRESKSLTMKQLSERSNLSPAQISRIETGSRGTPKPDSIKKLAIGLGVEYNFLMKIAGYTYTDEQLPEQELPFIHLLSNHPLLVDALLGLTDEELSALTILLLRK